MNAKLLLTIADDVRETPAGHFDMEWWMPDPDCGFACCAIGNHKMRHPESALDLSNGKPELLVGGHLFIGFRALAEYLDIFVDEAEHLFASDSYMDAEQTNRYAVAERIEKFVADRLHAVIEMKPEKFERVLNDVLA